ncbi:hypothetical protein AF78_03625 [Aliarcobacter butzleri L353]|nr:hypothetical protein AF78_03625 [Aliarcobacter butzleri L353]
MTEIFPPKHASSNLAGVAIYMLGKFRIYKI